MKVIHGLQNFQKKEHLFLTIGTFDGVHVGHQEILKKMVTEARKKNKISTLLTFFPHPRMVLHPNTPLLLIDTMQEKQHLLQNIGLDLLIIHSFSKAFSKLSALEFTRDILVNALNTKKLVIGHDHHFGKNREATATQLKTWAKQFEFEVEVIPAQTVGVTTISSTKIRNAITKNDFDTVTQYLNRPFRLTGKVVSGQAIGNQIHFPTANIHVEESYKIIPSRGVYWVVSQIKGKKYFGMMNIGVRPTVNGKHQTIEVHFFDFDGSLYNQTLAVDVLKKIRNEQKFKSLDALKYQLEKDKKYCLELNK